jgi:phage shock protein A
MDPVRHASRRLKGWLDSFLAPAEDPRRAFAGPDAHARALLEQLSATLDQIAATERRVAEHIAALRQQVVSLEARARRDLQAGREDQARRALEVHHLAASRLRSSEARLREMEEDEQRLLRLEQRVRWHLEAVRGDETAKAARQPASGDAPTPDSIHRQLGQTRAWIAALEDLIALEIDPEPSLSANDAVEREFERIAMAQAVEAQLADLRRGVEVESEEDNRAGDAAAAHETATESDLGRDPPGGRHGAG